MQEEIYEDTQEVCELIQMSLGLKSPVTLRANLPSLSFIVFLHHHKICDSQS